MNPFYGNNYVQNITFCKYKMIKRCIFIGQKGSLNGFTLVPKRNPTFICSLLPNAVMEICDFPHTSYVSISNAFVTNTIFPLSIITSNQTFEVVVQIILGFSEESKAHIFHGSLPLQLLFWTSSSLSPKIIVVLLQFSSLVT